MNEILLNDVSKRYTSQWVLRNLNYCFAGPAMYGVAGRNGSGKSTLMQIMSGYLPISSGKVEYIVSNSIISSDHIFKEVSLVGPYTDLINEFTLKEMFLFHFLFKPAIREFTFQEFEEIIELKKQGNKYLHHFSSGMKQKIQLALALLTRTPFVLLDEPTAFLDSNAKQWFSSMLDNYAEDRLIIISSNDPFDLEHCSSTLIMS
jgi:ABC-type multidrug transport system ATPase subunit